MYLGFDRKEKKKDWIDSSSNLRPSKWMPSAAIIDRHPRGLHSNSNIKREFAFKDRRNKAHYLGFLPSVGISFCQTILLLPNRPTRFLTKMKIPPRVSLGLVSTIIINPLCIYTCSEEQIESPFSADESFLALHLKKRSHAFHAMKFRATLSLRDLEFLFLFLFSPPLSCSSFCSFVRNI